MTEFITRNYGNKNFEIIIKTDSKEHYKATENFARGLIDHTKPAPTIETKPVVHAHWLEQIIDGGQELMCSNCGEYALMNDEFYSEFSKYCPYCGAQMDEKENDNG